MSDEIRARFVSYTAPPSLCAAWETLDAIEQPAIDRFGHYWRDALLRDPDAAAQHTAAVRDVMRLWTRYSVADPFIRRLFGMGSAGGRIVNAMLRLRLDTASLLATPDDDLRALRWIGNGSIAIIRQLQHDMNLDELAAQS